MTEGFQRELAVFSAARRLQAEAREAYLNEACAGEAGLRQRVEELLQVGEEAEGFLQAPASGAQRPEAASAASGVGLSISAPGEKAGDRIGRYKLLQQIGEGGCGVVYMAEQEEPVRRRVALKVIKLGMDTKQVIARFEAERQALALMDHPSIAKVLEAGATDTGRPYFVMELVRGIRITDYCDEGRLSTEARLGLFIQVAQAVQHAHQKGIIHRDLKPSNILVADHDGVPVPKIIDFGIAKATTDQRLTDKTLFTAFEQFIGTPAYMSPEQARMSGLDIDTRTDIYSLGVLLYELLTGKTPFDAQELLAAGLEEMRRTISEQEPAKPSTRLSTMLEGELTTTARSRHTDAPKLIHRLRGDLDWIVMKALEKDRARRYETANGLAMDIQRHLNCEPVLARPPNRLYEFQKTVRRHKFGFAAAGALIAALTVGALVSTWEAIRATRAERDQSRLRQQAEQAGATAKRQEQLARESADEARRQQRLASEQELLARRRFYAAQMNLANQAVEAGQPGRALELLETQRPQSGQEDLRGFDWYYLWGRCNVRHRGTIRGETSPVYYLAFSPDGKTLASSAGRQGTIRLWDLTTGRDKVVLEGVSARAVAFTPDGQTLVSAGADHLVRLWDLSSGKDRTILSGHTAEVRAVAVAPDGRILVSGDDQSIVKLWDASTGREVASIVHPHGVVLAAAFSPDGKTLATASGWNADAGVVLWDLASGFPQPRLQLPGALSVAFSPDGRTLVTAKDGIRLYDATTGQLQDSQEGNWDGTISVAYLPDGKTLASGSQDRTVRLWQLPLATGPAARNRIIGAHLEPVLCVGVSQDGRLLATGANDGSIELWDLSRTQEQLEARVAMSFQAGDGLESLFFSPEGRTLFATTENGTSLIDLASRLPYAQLPEAACCGALSPDGKVLATATIREGPGTLRLWDQASGRLLHLVEAHPNRVYALAFSTGGRIVASGGLGDSTVRLWDTATLKPLGTIATPGHSVSALSFSPDGRTLAAGNPNNTVVLFDPSTGRERLTLELGSGFLWIWATAFSRDGKLLAAGGEAGIVKLWDAQTGKPRAMLKGHTGAIRAIAFSPDGSIVVSGGSDRTVRLWDVASGQERITFKGFTNTVEAVAFAPDGNTLAAGSERGQITIWRGKRGLEGFARADAAQDDEHARWVRSKAEALMLSDYERAVHHGLDYQAAERLNEGSNKLVRLYESAGWLEQAGEWRKRAEAATRRASGSDTEAEALAREALARQRELYANEDPALAKSIYSLADVLVGQGSKLVEAESLLREAVAMQRKLFGDENQDLARSLANLANVLSLEDRSSEAEPLFHEALGMRRHLLGNQSPEVAWSLDNLGSFLYYQGRWAEAETALREALDIRRKLYASDQPEVLDVLDLLAMTLVQQNRLLEAEALARECLAGREKKMPDDWRTCSTRSLLGNALLGQKKYSAETELLLLTAYRGMKQRQNTMPSYARPRLRETVQRLVQLYGETNRPDQAGEWRQKLDELDQSLK